jgi:hypothetical protein
MLLYFFGCLITARLKLVRIDTQKQFMLLLFTKTKLPKPLFLQSKQVEDMRQ